MLSKIVTNPHFGMISPEKLIRVAPSLAVWGAAAGSAVALLGSDVPLVKKDILSRIPIAGAYWAVPEADEEE
ncbi:ubiquinol-cytochrome-c reductase complex subunit-domain-containing protein [Zychaea mexicana]|uniref:ubiquinol-cytochrome-c reductase complex subunit-domain-containing protein n=1 Tax=Zychaea mexicana TaxID=64656 RepID=UPI0022FE5858|nr:ubiquinol-cytochrome-c reductase complex subunit-domain-containing protein [Zychaea mexicana]KAI9495375.1 ubiquinol-cytochrome-c reductase complex subunit-domain-containing protein [Zychaea mexicana]